MKPFSQFLQTLRISLFFLLGISTIAYSQFTKLYDFNVTPGANKPWGGVVSDGTYLYGITAHGGTLDSGAIFKILPDGTGYSQIHDFSSPINGTGPEGTMAFDGTYLYGTTAFGGTYHKGTLFKILPDGTGFTKLLDFNGAGNGNTPYGSLLLIDSTLYGTTTVGGPSGGGTVFKISTDGSGYAILANFDAITGSTLYMGLEYDGTFLYGACWSGGANSAGTIYKVKPDGTGFLKIFDFTTATSGSHPYGRIHPDGGFLFGTTRDGGANGEGTLFRIMPDGTGYTKLLDFGTTNGENPSGNLVSEGGYIYGCTAFGGSNNRGCIFRFMPDGSNYSVVQNFTGTATGSYTSGQIISDGNFFYGMTSASGYNGEGTVFKYQHSFTGIEQNDDEITIMVFPNPTSGTLNLSLKKGVQDANLDVLDMFGEIVISISDLNLLPEENYSINISNLSNGTYIMRIGNCQKVVIKN